MTKPKFTPIEIMLASKQLDKNVRNLLKEETERHKKAIASFDQVIKQISEIGGNAVEAIMSNKSFDFSTDKLSEFKKTVLNSVIETATTLKNGTYKQAVKSEQQNTAIKQEM